MEPDPPPKKNAYLQIYDFLQQTHFRSGMSSLPYQYFGIVFRGHLRIWTKNQKHTNYPIIKIFKKYIIFFLFSKLGVKVPVRYRFPSLFTPTRYKGAPRPCQLKLVVWIHFNVPMIVCVHVGTMAVRVQGMYCIVLHMYMMYDWPVEIHPRLLVDLL